MEKLNRAQNFGASKTRVKGGLEPLGSPLGSAPESRSDEEEPQSPGKKLSTLYKQIQCRQASMGQLTHESL